MPGTETGRTRCTSGSYFLPGIEPVGRFASTRQTGCYPLPQEILRLIGAAGCERNSRKRCGHPDVDVRRQIEKVSTLDVEALRGLGRVISFTCHPGAKPKASGSSHTELRPSCGVWQGRASSAALRLRRMGGASHFPPRRATTERDVRCRLGPVRRHSPPGSETWSRHPVRMLLVTPRRMAALATDDVLPMARGAPPRSSSNQRSYPASGRFISPPIVFGTAA